MDLIKETCIIYNRMLHLANYPGNRITLRVWSEYLEKTPRPYGISIMIDLGDRIERLLAPLPEMRERKRILKETIEYVRDYN